MSNTVVFGNLKGGTGKSNILFQVAGELSRRNKKVLIADLDAQANLTTNLAIDIFGENGLRGTDEIFEGEVDPREILIKDIKGNIDLLPTSIKLAKTEFKIAGRMGRELLLIKYFKKYRDFFNEYDYVLIDTNPSFNAVNMNSFLAADSMILVGDMGINSYLGMNQFIDLYEELTETLNFESKIKALTLNKSRGYADDKSMIEMFKDDEYLNSLMTETVFPLWSVFARSEVKCCPISLMEDNNKEVVKAKAIIEEYVDELIAKGVM